MQEFAWGSTSITQPTGLLDEGTILETTTPGGANANYASGEDSIGGPVRVGSFAAPGRSRRDAGAGYYGALDLSGNLSERIVTVGNETGRAFEGTHGDGALTDGGNATVPSWTGASGVGTGSRGGRWGIHEVNVRLSLRANAANAAAPRSHGSGWRGARSAP